MNTRRRINLLQLVVLAMVLGLYGLLIEAVSRYPVVTDFFRYHYSARAFWEGQTIYGPVPAEEAINLPEGVEFTPEDQHPNLSPPPLTLFLAPLGLWEARPAFVTWSVFSLLSGLGGAALLGITTVQASGRLRRVLWLALGVMLYFPSVANARLGQVSFVLLLLLTIAWVGARSGREGATGVAMGLAVSIKPFAGLLILLFLVRRRWRVLLWCGLTLAVASVASLLAFGASAFGEFVGALSNVTWYAASWNASLLGYLARILGGSENVPLVQMPGLAYTLYYCVLGAALLAFVWLVWPRQDELTREALDLGFGLCLALMLLLSPLGWMYYFPLLLPAGVAAWTVCGTPELKRLRWPLVIIWLASTIPIPLVKAPALNDPLSWFTWAGLHFYALLAFSLILAWMVRHVSQLSVALPERLGPSVEASR